jgi:hypothetical protein
MDAPHPPTGETRAMTITIAGGTEKQNAWATKIAQEWVSHLDNEISNAAARPISDNVQWYADNLIAAKGHFIEGLGKAAAKQVIDLYVAKRNPVTALINQARSR